MRVVGVSEFGGPEALRVFDIPDPQTGPGEVRIRVRAATVNPTDTFTRNGARAEALRKGPPPYVAGMDIAGVVDEIGAGVAAGFGVGEHVMAIVVASLRTAATARRSYSPQNRWSALRLGPATPRLRPFP